MPHVRICAGGWEQSQSLPRPNELQTPAPDPEAAERLADAMIEFLRGGPVPDPPTADPPRERRANG